jgi:hypothetical protein
MPEKLQNNFYPDDPDDEELNQILSEKDFLNRTRHEAQRRFSKAAVLKNRLLKWIKNRIIKETNNVVDILKILKIKKNELNPKQKNYDDKLKEIRVIENQLKWFLMEGMINENTSIEDLMILLEQLIQENKEIQIFLEKNIK